jgi:aspartate oxidase
VTVRGNGTQIEQPLAVRDEIAPRDAIARAVAELYADLI